MDAPVTTMNAMTAVAASSGTRRTKPPPLRRCAVTGRRLDRRRLVRFVVAPEGVVVPDIAAALPGRGIWISAERSIVERAVRKNGCLSKAGRASRELADQVEALLLSRCQSLLGIGRRAGEVVVGRERTWSAVRGRRVGAVVVASDASDGGRRKLESLCDAIVPGTPQIDVMDRFELGTAIGRAASAYMALLPGRLPERLIESARMLGGFRGAGSSGSGFESVRETGAR